MSKRILIVDDSSTVRRQLRNALEAEGYWVTEADSGQFGLTAAASTSFQLIIVDVNMPGMDGLQMISEIRQLPNHLGTPIFVLTTESAPDVIARGKAVGATAWIVKPFNPSSLLKGINKVLAD